jgi:predicted nucleic acid-binding protein
MFGEKNAWETNLPIDERVWRQAKRLGRACRRNGTPVPSSDLLIASCAWVHGAALDAEKRETKGWVAEIRSDKMRADR